MVVVVNQNLVYIDTMKLQPYIEPPNLVRPLRVETLETLNGIAFDTIK